MRLPWPFRRNPQASSPNEAGMAPVAQREQRADWRNLPPLSETMAPPPLVAPNSRFSAGLAVNNAPPPSLGHMGHQRSLDATPGLALGLAKPVSRSVDAAAASAPVRASGSGLRRFLQRRTATAAPAAQSWPDDPAPAQPGAPSVDGPVQPVSAAAVTAQRSATTSRPSSTGRSTTAAGGGPAPTSLPTTTAPMAIARRPPALPLARRVSPVPKDEAVTPTTNLTTAPRELSAPTVQRSAAASSPSPTPIPSPIAEHGLACCHAERSVPARCAAGNTCQDRSTDRVA